MHLAGPLPPALAPALLLLLLLALSATRAHARWLTPLELVLSTGLKRPKVSLPGAWPTLGASNGTRAILGLEYTTLPLGDSGRIRRAIAASDWPVDVRVAPRDAALDPARLFNSSAASTVFVTAARDGPPADRFVVAGWSVEHVVSQVFVGLRREAEKDAEGWLAAGVERDAPFVLSCPPRRVGGVGRHVANLNVVNIPESSWNTTRARYVPRYIRELKSKKDVRKFFSNSRAVTVHPTEIHYRNTTENVTVRMAGEGKGDIPNRNQSPLEQYPFTDEDILCNRIALSGPGAPELVQGIMGGLEEFTSVFAQMFTPDGVLSEASAVIRALENAPQVEYLTGAQGFILVVLPTAVGICELLAHGVPRKKLHYLLLLAICMYEVMAVVFFWRAYGKQRNHAVIVQVRGVTSASPVIELTAGVRLATDAGSFPVPGLRAGDTVTLARSERIQIVSYQVGTDLVWAVLVSVGLLVELLIAGHKIMTHQREFIGEVIEKRRAARELYRARMSDASTDTWDMYNDRQGFSFYAFENTSRPDDGV